MEKIFDAQIVQTSEKGVLVDCVLGEGDGPRVEVWFPKSQIRIDKETKAVFCPSWLVDSKSVDARGDKKTNAGLRIQTSGGLGGIRSVDVDMEETAQSLGLDDVSFDTWFNDLFSEERNQKMSMYEVAAMAWEEGARRSRKAGMGWTIAGSLKHKTEGATR